mgnify:CR=1 FL=1
MERNDQYPGLDVSQSGKSLRYQIRRAGYNIREIQDYLHLSCPQPVYRWLRGKTLPSVDHLYALSRLFGVHMEELLADGGENPVCGEIFLEKQYLLSYLGKFRKAV